MAPDDTRGASVGAQSSALPRSGHGLPNTALQASAITAAVRGSAAPVAALNGCCCDVAMDDWDDLFDAVKERLLWVASPQFGVSIQLEPERPLDRVTFGGIARLQRSVLECVAALDQLHRTVINEMNRRPQLLPADADGPAKAKASRTDRLTLFGPPTALASGAGFRERVAHQLSKLPLRGGQPDS
jgi:hypothetical protein